MKLSVIIPAYKEEKNILSILKAVTALKKTDLHGLDREIIVVDDGSDDRTYELASQIRAIKLIRHEKNMGKGAAVRTGIDNSTGEIVVIQDADLEYNPREIPKLLKEFLGGSEIVYGSRFMGNAERMSFTHNLGNKFLSFATSILYGQKITDMETCYKMFRRDVIKDMRLEGRGFEIEPEITAKLLKKGYRIREIPINYVAREKSEKKINWKDGVVALRWLLKLKITGK